MNIEGKYSREALTLYSPTCVTAMWPDYYYLLGDWLRVIDHVHGWLYPSPVDWRWLLADFVPGKCAFPDWLIPR